LDIELRNFSMGARSETDVGDLTEAIAIAEKELRERVYTYSNFAVDFPDGSRQIWCASSITSRREDFYNFVQESLDKVSIEDLYRVSRDTRVWSGSQRFTFGSSEKIIFWAKISNMKYLKFKRFLIENKIYL